MGSSHLQAISCVLLRNCCFLCGSLLAPQILTGYVEQHGSPHLRHQAKPSSSEFIALAPEKLVFAQRFLCSPVAWFHWKKTERGCPANELWQAFCLSGREAPAYLLLRQKLNGRCSDRQALWWSSSSACLTLLPARTEPWSCKWQQRLMLPPS